ncbi:MAG: ribokinase [Synergistaceae bacterium]|nr:ribokinase [Synergistaceae bacterium]
MKKLVFGSLNIDRTYTVEHFVSAGETISAEKMNIFCGGKGLNQAVAMSRAGSEVYFAGAIGADGDILLQALQNERINIDCVKRTDGASGHAVIQVDKSGSNCIMILAGSNGEIGHADVDRVLSGFDSGDLVLLQNEISSLDYIISQAHKKGMKVALNPSPFNKAIERCELSELDYLIVNEVEGAAICGESSWRAIIDSIRSSYPSVSILLTLGHRGSVYYDKDGAVETCGIYRVPVTDTTAAGDTFVGYFLTKILAGGSVSEALTTAATASAIAVSRAGALPSIPFAQELKTADMILMVPFNG